MTGGYVIRQPPKESISWEEHPEETTAKTRDLFTWVGTGLGLTGYWGTAPWAHTNS